MKSFFVDVRELLEKPGEEIAFSGQIELEPTKLGAELVEFTAPVAVDLALANVTEGVMIRGRAAGDIRLRCGRCLEKFDYETTVDIEELAVAGDSAGADDEVFAVDSGRVDLAAVVYQCLIVEVPIQPLCRAGCAGLCAACGKNLNDEPHDHPESKVDKRLASLKDFFKKE